MAVIKVHGSVISTATMRVLLCLHEKGLEYDLVPVNMATGDHKKEPFLSLNPFGQVPAFEDCDLKLFESRAITQYLAYEYAGKGTSLIFPDSKKMATAGVWMEVEAHQFDTVASKLAWELVFKPMLGMATDAGQVAELQGKLGVVLDVYEKRLGVSKYLGGDIFSLADMHHLPILDYLMGTPVKEVFYSRKNVGAWCDDILARSSWKKVAEMKSKPHV